MSLSLIKYVFLAAIRDKLILALLLIMSIGAALSTFLGSAAIIEKDQFSLVFAAGSLRIITIVGLTLFIVFFLRRSFESKDIEYLLSKPVSRFKFLLSYSFALSALSAFVSFVCGLVICIVSWTFNDYGHSLWVLSLVVESIVMANVALFFSMYLTSASSASMAIFSFYILSRMMGQLLGIANSTLVDDYGPAYMVLQFVSVVIPRLDLFGQTSWLIYGMENLNYFLIILAQGIVFSVLVFLATLLDLIKRQF